ncbi:DUF1501 domain-containing protein [Chitinimonas arctica]|nr:DUF1501 domain-containing protein [Chitinimonas arctica]
MSAAPSSFCFGPHPTDPLDHRNDRLLNMKNSRGLALSDAVDLPGNAYDRSMANSLRNYYESKAAKLAQSDVYGRFIQSERSLRQFGSSMNRALDAQPIPAPISKLYTGLPPSRLNNANMGEQIRNLYDAIRNRDLFDMRVASLCYDGWDSHAGEIAMIEPRYEDLFGTGKALDTLWQSVEAASRQNMVLVLGGEFGRQLRANGAGGTDHGRGSHMIVIGENVRGGFYGNPFPTSELAKLGKQSPDIDGLTAIERVYASISEWVAPGAGSVVFPGVAGMPQEPGNALNLFRA